jgi:hypothetical protein
MLKRFVIFKSPEPPRWRSLYPEQQRCRELSAKSLVTELKLIFCFRTAGNRCTVERVVLNALAKKNAALPLDICAFGEVDPPLTTPLPDHRSPATHRGVGRG